MFNSKSRCTCSPASRVFVSKHVSLLFLLASLLLSPFVLAQQNNQSSLQLLLPPTVEGDELDPEAVPGVTFTQSLNVQLNEQIIDAFINQPLSELQLLSQITLTLFDGNAYQLLIERKAEIAGGGVVISGSLDNTSEGGFDFVVPGSGSVTATFTVNGQLFRLIKTTTGFSVIDIEESAYPDELEPIDVILDDDSSSLLNQDPSVEQDDGSTLDILVVYTAAAKAQIPGGTTADIEAHINLAVSEANTGFANSGIQYAINVVHIAEVNYLEDASMQVDLNRLRITNDGFMDSVHGLRDTYAADTVALIRSSGGGACGIGYRMANLSPQFADYAFTVTAQSCAVGNLSFAHEIGHNLGSHHDRFVVNSTNNLFPYSFGYVHVDQSNSANSFRSVMAYRNACGNCTRINRWSNAEQTYQGVPLGVLSTDLVAADNELSINMARFTASNWRTTQAGPPTFSAPSAGTPLSSSEVFSWVDNGAPVTAWWLYLGTTLGANDIHDSGSTTSTSVTVNTVPQTGDPIFARLWYKNGSGPWLYVDTTYDTQFSQPPAITTPVPGSTLTASSETFSWVSNGAAVTNYWLEIGNVVGGNQYANSGDLSSALTYTASVLPTDGSILFVRLWWRLAGQPWVYADYTYTAASIASNEPDVTSHTPGDTLAGASDTFTWVDNGSGATEYWLYVGSTQGGLQYFNSASIGAANSAAVNTLPIDGSDVWVRLWYRASSSAPWLFIDEQYVAEGQLPTITSPAPGSVLGGATETFTWNDPSGSVTAWWFYAGSTVGGKEYEDSGNLNAAVSYTTLNANLPTGSVPVNVRLWYQLGAGTPWKFVDETYTSAP